MTHGYSYINAIYNNERNIFGLTRSQQYEWLVNQPHFLLQHGTTMFSFLLKEEKLGHWRSFLNNDHITLETIQQLDDVYQQHYRVWSHDAGRWLSFAEVLSAMTLFKQHPVLDAYLATIELPPSDYKVNELLYEVIHWASYQYEHNFIVPLAWEYFYPSYLETLNVAPITIDKSKMLINHFRWVQFKVLKINPFRIFHNGHPVLWLFDPKCMDETIGQIVSITDWQKCFDTESSIMVCLNGSDFSLPLEWGTELTVGQRVLMSLSLIDDDTRQLWCQQMAWDQLVELCPSIHQHDQTQQLNRMVDVITDGDFEWLFQHHNKHFVRLLVMSIKPMVSTYALKYAVYYYSKEQEDCHDVELFAELLDYPLNQVDPTLYYQFIINQSQSLPSSFLIQWFNRHQGERFASGLPVTIFSLLCLPWVNQPLVTQFVHMHLSQMDWQLMGPPMVVSLTQMLGMLSEEHKIKVFNFINLDPSLKDALHLAVTSNPEMQSILHLLGSNQYSLTSVPAASCFKDTIDDERFSVKRWLPTLILYGFEHLTQLHPGFQFLHLRLSVYFNAWDRFCDVILLSDERLYPLYAFKYSDYGALVFFINDDRIHPKELSRWFLCSPS